MKIIHVLPALTKGGAERVAVDLANASVAAGHEVAVVLAFPVDPALLQKDLDRRVDVRFVCRRPSRLSAYSSLLAWLVRNRVWLRSRDVIHCHLSFGAVFGSAFQILRGTRRGSPAVVETYHAVGLPIPWLHRALHRRLLAHRDCAALIANDSYWNQFAAGQGRNRPVVIPNGVRFDAQLPTAAEAMAYRRECGLPDGALVVGTVGRLVTARHPDRIVEVFAQVARCMPGVHFLWAGEGPERRRVIALARQHGIAGQVHLPGLLLRPALAFANIDLYLTINVGSVTGIAALEAAVVGRPIVALQADADYRNEPCDWIWSSANLSEVGRLCVELLKSAEDRFQLAARQQRHVLEHRGIAPMLDAYLQLYSLALDQAS